MATAPEAKAPAQQKAPAKFNKARFDELHARDDLSEAEEQEYISLRKLRGESAKARKTAIAALVEQMKEHGITMLDLKSEGVQVPDLDKLYDAETIKLVAAPMFPQATASKGKKTAEGDTPKRNVTKPLKSTGNAGEGVWLAHPPKFLETEGAHTAYLAGKAVDQWLTDPANKAQKGNFLAKLAKKHGKQPNKEQLGDLTAEEVKTK